MDLNHIRGRSASNSSLHSAYSRNGGRHGNFSHPRQPSHRRPLRSLNETASMLRSPGPLESMLKTTTETGDIGIFSIGQLPPLPATYHQPPRPRPQFTDANLYPPSCHAGGFEDGYYHDDRRRLPSSYRDTTSEIISLYASDTQPSYSRSFSPSLEDGPRSYSLTTCSSRHMPSQKSSGTLQSQSSVAGLQRPRSPFPYPTRLKRPGVRPASPAVTENGGIDYSRMVELDRVSHRTVHGSYRPSYGPCFRRPPPPALRHDANRSTSSLPSRSSPGLYYGGYGGYGGYGPNRIRAPSSPAPWMPRPPCRQRVGSADQIVRTSSLTSIVEMYQRPVAPNAAGPPLRSPGSFYYDYSEEFEKQVPGALEPSVPLCPIPQRAGSNSQPLVLRDETQARLDGAIPTPRPEEIDCYERNDEVASSDASGAGSRDAHQRASHGDLTQSPISSDDELANRRSQTSAWEISPEDRLSEEAQCTKAARVDVEPAFPLAVASQEQDESAIRTAVVPLARSSPARRTFSPPPGDWRRSKTIGVEQPSPDIVEQKDSAKSNLTRLRSTWDPSVCEFASILSSFDRSSKPLSPKKDENVPPNIKDQPVGVCSTIRDYSSVVGLELGNQSPVQSLDGDTTENNSYRKKHRRNIAAMQISTRGFCNDESNSNMVPAPAEEVTILSPEPVSPSSQLRLQNSIPQLMKALPPLPGDTWGDMNNAVRASSTPAHSGSGVTLPGGDSQVGQLVNCGPLESPTRGVLAKMPKFKLRIQTSSSSSAKERTLGSSDDYGSEHHPFVEKNACSTPKPKLRLKVARNRQGKGVDTRDGTVIRSQDLKECCSLNELEHCSGTDLFSRQPDFEGFLDITPRSETAKSPTHKKMTPSPKISGRFKAPYTPSRGRVKNHGLRSSTSTNKVMLSEMRSFSSDVGPRQHRGLRQKISMLRLRLTRSQKIASASGAEGSRQVSDGLDPRRVISDAPVQPRRGGDRVKKWANDVKRAVRFCVRKTLDHSSRGYG